MTIFVHEREALKDTIVKVRCYCKNNYKRLISSQNIYCGTSLLLAGVLKIIKPINRMHRYGGLMASMSRCEYGP